MPRISFFLDTFKIILDTIRQNSRLLDLYTQCATKLFEFCFKYKSKKEYLRVSEMLHMHFQYILKYTKQPELANKAIPYPVTLKDDECTSKLLDVRQVQLEYALKMGEWSDAFRTSEIIFNLINRREKHSTKQILQSFFNQLSAIFWKSENHLFHSYALTNLLKIVRTSTATTTEQKQQLSC